MTGKRKPETIGRRGLWRRRDLGKLLIGALFTPWAPHLLRADALPTVAPLPMGVLQSRGAKRFTGRGSGGYSGESWPNSMPVTWLSKSLALAEPGSAYFIGFQRGKVQPLPTGKTQVILQVSGEPDKPIYVAAGYVGDDAGFKAAADGDDQEYFFRTMRPWAIRDVTGGRQAPCYVAIRGHASYLQLSGFRFDGSSADGFIKFQAKKTQPATFTDIGVSGIRAVNVGRVIETEQGAAVQRLAVADCKVKGIVRGFARFWALSDATFRNLELDADHFDGGGKNVCQIVSIVSGENILFENVVLKNAVNEIDAGLRDKGNAYVQGDGIVCEAKTKNLTIRKCKASGMGDAGFDLKTTDVTIEDSQTENCKFGARLWSHSNNVVRRCSFSAPHSRGKVIGAGLQALGSVEVHDSKIQAGAGTSAFSLSRHGNAEPPVIKVFGGSVQLEPGAALAIGSPGGVLELHDVSVNGSTRNQRYELSEQTKGVQ